MFPIDEDALELERRADALVQNHRHMLEKLVQMRREHNLTQAEVAFRMGVSQPTVAAFERYDSNPTLATIRRYALAVHATLVDRVFDDCHDAVPGRWVSDFHSEAVPWGASANAAGSVAQWELRRPSRHGLVSSRG